MPCRGSSIGIVKMYRKLIFWHIFIIKMTIETIVEMVNYSQIKQAWFLNERRIKHETINEQMVIQSRICTAFILSIRLTLRFSRHRLENRLGYCLGRIMQHYYRLKMRKLVTGMRKKPQNRLGVFVLCRGTFLLSIITVCSRHRKKSL